MYNRLISLSRNNILTKSQNGFREGQLRQQYTLESIQESSGGEDPNWNILLFNRSI
jgi:hypothetical protein